MMMLAIDRGMIWDMADGINADYLGFIPSWFSLADERPAIEQANSGYMHTAGCGFTPFEGFDLRMNKAGKYELVYTKGDPEYPDPPNAEWARTKLRDETIIVFDSAWTAIVQKDGSFVVARCD